MAINKGFDRMKNATEKYNAEAIYRKSDIISEIQNHETRVIKFEKFEDLATFHLFTDADTYGGDTYCDPSLNIQDDSCKVI